MGRTMCPGQDTMFWSADDVFEIPCGNCGHEIEFFRDDARRRCPKCQHMVKNPKLNLGCALWCEHAKECLGYDPKEKLAAGEGGASLVDQLVDAMKMQFGKDEKRINHALEVLGHAQDLIKSEEGDPKVVLSAAVLHDIGIQEAEKKHGSNRGRYQEMEGPPIARPIMEGLGMDKETIDHVCDIIANHHTVRGMDTPEFRILWDSDWLANIPDVYPDFDKEHLSKLINKVFKTETGKQKALSMYAQ
ncbi:metal dependent phosphohydrolase [Desulfatibacillum aliphaticivorans]|uniref:Metal dependent phosphohydrolase n=1 Tax=Desulfatibacillum aliphaticivorans TaxID=218208 RepID=B8FAU7_DESAL|nr:HD domain-containing protein [Desulfatibacillum aliphaticivorans]ACL04033.1 metal dependent phosphohydrolase [Desulfatibacillum aliphaticivorans]